LRVMVCVEPCMMLVKVNIEHGIRAHVDCYVAQQWSGQYQEVQTSIVWMLGRTTSRKIMISWCCPWLPATSAHRQGYATVHPSHSRVAAMHGSRVSDRTQSPGNHETHEHGGIERPRLSEIAGGHIAVFTLSLTRLVVDEVMPRSYKMEHLRRIPRPEMHRLPLTQKHQMTARELDMNMSALSLSAFLSAKAAVGLLKRPSFQAGRHC
jgi:hypothetical protein